MPQAKLTRADLMSLEQYAVARAEFRTRVLEHKRQRTICVGPNLRWFFEDRLTVQYQIQEMLRTERIFEAEGILEELAAYNPLIPEGTNWKVTLMIEFPDVEERRAQLGLLKGIEDRCWVQVAGAEPIWAIADEDMDRENEEKTSAVHFLRFELGTALAEQVRAGGELGVGVDHPQYSHRVQPVSKAVRDLLAADLA